MRLCKHICNRLCALFRHTDDVTEPDVHFVLTISHDVTHLLSLLSYTELALNNSLKYKLISSEQNNTLANIAALKTPPP